MREEFVKYSGEGAEVYKQIGKRCAELLRKKGYDAKVYTPEEKEDKSRPKSITLSGRVEALMKMPSAYEIWVESIESSYAKQNRFDDSVYTFRAIADEDVLRAIAEDKRKQKEDMDRVEELVRESFSPSVCSKVPFTIEELGSVFKSRVK